MDPKQEERQTAVFAVVQEHPGIRTPEIAERTGLRQWTVRDALKELVRQDKVHSGGRWRWYPAENPPSFMGSTDTRASFTLKVSFPLSAVSDPEFAALIQKYDAQING